MPTSRDMAIFVLTTMTTTTTPTTRPITLPLVHMCRVINLLEKLPRERVMTRFSPGPSDI